MTSLPDAAAFLCQQWPVFVCGASKRPLTERGFKDAVRDPEAARRMFRVPGAALIGVPTGADSDLAVVDLDVKHGGGGLEWLAANEHRLPRTRRHRTRSGGLHLLFRYPAARTIRNSASKVAPGVDVRGEGGYIIAPPSDGYSVADDAMPASLPDWLLELLDPPAPPPRPAAEARTWRDGTAQGSPYGMAALSAECDAVMNAPFGAQETTLNAAGLKLGALAAGGEVDRSYALESLYRAALAMPSQGGRPAWAPAELRKKVERAFGDGAQSPRNAPPLPPRPQVVRIEVVAPEPPPYDAPPDHAYAEPDMAEDAAERGTREEAPPEPDKPALLIEDGTWEEARLPKRPWIAPGRILRGSVTVIAGPGSAGKSSLMIGWAVSLAAGREFGRFRPEKPGTTLLYNVEDDDMEQRRRMSAALRSAGLYPQDVAGRIIRAFPSGVGTLIEQDRATGRFRVTQAWDELDALVEDRRPDVVALDPMVELHTAEENDNTAVRYVVAQFRAFAQRHECGVVLFHHTRKGSVAGDPDSIRGAGATVGAGRLALTLTPMTKEEAEELNVPAAQRRLFSRLDNAKANYCAADEADWHELVVHELDNGEAVTAALPWEPSPARRQAAAPKPELLSALATAIAKGTPQGPYSGRLSLSEPRSILPLMMELGIKDPRTQKTALATLLGPSFGVTVQEFRDEHRKSRQGLRAPDGRPDAGWCAGSETGAEGGE